MSFSKAKIKRFNDVDAITSPSPSTRKECIKKFLKESSGLEKLMQEKANNENEQKETESVKSSKSLRLFRTPSLPKRLKFRNNSEASTPKPSSSASKSLFGTGNKHVQEALDAANAEIQNKSEILKGVETRLNELESEIHHLTTSLKKSKESINEKDAQIKVFENEIQTANSKSLEFEQKIHELEQKNSKLEDEIKSIVKSHENEINFLVGLNSEIEVKNEKALTENKCLTETLDELRGELFTTQKDYTSLRDLSELKNSKFNELEADAKSLNNQITDLLQKLGDARKRSEEDMLCYAAESSKLLQEIENLRKDYGRLENDLKQKDKLLMELKEEIEERDIEMDTMRDAIRLELVEQIKEESEEKIRTLNENHQLEIIQLAQDNHQNLEEYQKKLKKLEDEYLARIEHINDSAMEKIRISEIQTEEKIKNMEHIIDETVELEKQKKQTEMQRIQSDLEQLQALHAELLQQINDKDKVIYDLMSQCKFENENVQQYETRLQSLLTECNQLRTEKYNYQLTLQSTRSTVNVLTDRLRKSDMDVETLKDELVTLQEKYEATVNDLEQQTERSIEYRDALETLKNSCVVFEQEFRQKESQYFEKSIIHEKETLDTVNNIEKLLNSKIDENLSKYSTMYSELLAKYESRELYIKNLKTQLDEFSRSIELALLELDAKNKLISSLETENRNIKLENMTIKYKCEQFEKYDSQSSTQSSTNGSIRDRDDDHLISNAYIDDIIQRLETDGQEKKNYLEDTILTENANLKQKVMEQTKQIQILKELIELEHHQNEEKVKMENIQNIEKQLLSQQTSTEDKTSMQIDELKEANEELKTQLTNLQSKFKEQEFTIRDLKDQVTHELTPKKLNASGKIGTPKTPKTFAGKENRCSPMPTGVIASPKLNLLKPRNLY